MSCRVGFAVVMLCAGALLAPAAAQPNAAVPLFSPPAWASASADLGRVADQPIAHLTVMLARAPERQRAFEALRAEQETPGAPGFHHWLTARELGARFGASDADLAEVTSWLTSRGLAILRVGNARTFVEVSGTTRAAEAAFGVELHRYRAGGHVLRAPDRAPAIPAALARVVAGVTGLVETTSAPQVRSPRRIVDGSGDHVVGISDFATIYDLAPVYADGVDGGGQTVGIIGRSRVFAADITNFGASQGATLAPFTTIVPPTTGVDPGSACGDAACGSASSIDDQLEATLDVTRVTSIATGANVELIVSATDASGDDGVAIALEFAVDDFGAGADANILTVSFGECEQTLMPAGVQAFDALYEQAAAQGQTVFVSAGNAGAAGCDLAFQTPPATQVLGVNGLCTSPDATCVGGTEPADVTSPSTYWSGSGAALSYIPEGVWNEPTRGSATFAQGGCGGISQAVALPGYQDGLGANLGSNAFRIVPDVSLMASCHDAYVICFAAAGAGCVPGQTGELDFDSACGTSAAAPSLAAIMALVFERTGGSAEGPANPGFYSLGAQPANLVFNDVTVASSGVAAADCTLATPSTCNNSDPGPTGLSGGLAGYLAGSGFDAATGWGSVDVGALAATWNTELAPALAVIPGSATVAAGESATVGVVPTGLFAPVFACSGLPANATCQFAGGGATMLTIATDGATGAQCSVTADGGGGRRRSLLGLAGALAFALAAKMQRPRWRPRAVALGFAAVAAGSCGGGKRSVDARIDAPTTPAGTYTVVVTATSGTVTASADLALLVTN